MQLRLSGTKYPARGRKQKDEEEESGALYLTYSRRGGKENAFVDHISHKSGFKVRLLKPLWNPPIYRGSVRIHQRFVGTLRKTMAPYPPPHTPLPRPHPQHLTAGPLWAGVRKEAGRDKWCNLLHPSPADPSQHPGLPVTETPVSTLLCCFHRQTLSCTGHFQNPAS